MNADEILIKLGIDGSKVEAGFKSIKEKGASFAKDLTMFIAAPLAAIGTSEGVMKVIEFGESIKHVAEATGASTDKVQGFRYAMQQTGGTAESADKALEKLNVKIGEAAEGNVEAAKAFKDLGVSISNADGSLRTSDEILGDVANAIKNTTDPAKKSAEAFSIWGKSAQDLIPLLNQGSDGIDRFEKSATKLSEADLIVLVKLKEDMNDLSTTSEVATGKFISGIALMAKSLGKFSVTHSFKDLIGLGDYDDDAKKGAGGAVKESEALIRARERLAKIKQDDANVGLKGEEKINALIWERQGLYDDMAIMNEKSVEFVNAQIEVERISTDIKKEQAKIDAEAAKAAEEAAQKAKKIAQETADIERDKAHLKQEASEHDSSYMSISELANSGMWRGTGGYNTREAQRIEWLQRDEALARAKGNIGFADNERSQRLNLQQDLENRGIIKPEHYLESIDYRMDTLNKRLTELGVRIQDDQ